MAEYVGSFDPKQMSFIAAGIPMTGFAKGTFIEVSRNTPMWGPPVTGPDGNTTRVRSNDNSGTITLTLQQSAPSNEKLSNLANIDALTGKAHFPVLIKDNSGTSKHGASTAWVQDFPSATYGDDVQPRAWVIACANISMFIGLND